MKNTNPFNVPGTPIARLGQKSDARIKLVVAAVVVATVFLFSGLFIQGCQRQPATNAANTDNPAGGTSTDANGTAMTSSTATNTTAASTPDAGASNMTSTAATTAPASPAPGSPDTGAPPAPAGPTKDYVVAKGDSFYKIAKANHITMKALTEANPGTDSSKLKVGQTLHVPQAAESAMATASATAPAPSSAHATTTALNTSDSGEKSYVVKSGDTLGRIAKTHGTTVKAIKVANGLTSDRIAVGKSLKLPAGKAAPASAA